MSRRLLLLLVMASALWPLAPVRAQPVRPPSVADVVKVQGVIDSRVVALVERRMEATPDGGVVILQLDSPGTVGVDPLALAERFDTSPVPVVVWVGPPGALAQGSAVVLLEAAHVAATSPGSGVGPGHPADLVRPDEDGDATDAAVAYATERGRNAESVRDLFAPGAGAVPPQDSLDLGLVDLAAQSVLDLLGQLDGMEVETAAGTQTLVTEGAPEEFELRFSELGPVARTLHAVAAPTASYVLLVLGLWAIAFEVVQPGVGLAAVVGVIFLALAGYSLTILAPSWAGVVLLAGGIALLTVDVKLRKLALPTVLGAAAFAAGSLLIYRDAAERVGLSPWVIWPFVVATVLYFGFALTVAVRAREQAIASTGSGLVGLVGETAGDLAPEGQVVVKGAMWQGRSLAGPIPGGTRVRVRNVDGLVLEVTVEA